MEMEKAYDTKVLVEELKKKGIELAEDAARDLFVTVKDWYVASAKKSESDLDDVGLAVLPVIETLAMKYIDKIDGEVEGEAPAEPA